MKLAKKVVTLAMALTLAVSSLAVSAAPSATATDLSKATAKAANQTYNGKQQAAKLTVTVDGKTLVQDKDFKVVSGAQAKSAGKYTVTIEGIGSYKGTATASYTINKAKVTKKIKRTYKAKKAKTAKKKKVQISCKKSWAKTAGKLSVKVKSGKLSAKKAKKFFSKSGKGLVVKKGLAKGKYVVTVKYETKNYKITRKITVTVK
ncbi:MAG: hypothetical protein IJ137_01740 [Eubacterium sp.]|nr:hypothetical protein [Eubacterium sp.]